MIYEVLPQSKKALLALPESGMGYQIIDAKPDGRSTPKRFIVYNCELIIEFDSYFDIYKRFVVLQSYATTLNKSTFLKLDDPILVKRSELSNKRNLSESSMNSKGRHTGSKGSVDSEPRFGNGIDQFIRLSPYQDDIRIDFVNMKLKNGTFTTTEDDYLACKADDDDPIDRYALPSNETLNWAFSIIPKSYDKYRPGIVQPANNHSGGGIEALFDNGTSDGTYIERKPY